MNQPKRINIFMYKLLRHHCSDNQSQAPHRGGLGSIPGQIMWDLWWTKWHWGRFSPSASVSAATSHSNNCYTFTNHPIMDTIVSILIAR
jgi:hypothetical protein